ncbi:amidohydrolase family protein [Bacteroidota bacterium]
MKQEKFHELASTISSDPFSRVPDHIKPLLKDKNVLINCHCHIFNEKTVPKALFNMKMPGGAKFAKIARWLAKFLHKLNGRSNDDKWSRLAYFIELFMKSTREITDKLIYYFEPNGTCIFTPLMMDMHNRVGEDKRKPAEHYIKLQAKDIQELIEDPSKKYNLLPFLPIDPTISDPENIEFDVFDVFIKGFTGQYGFLPFGIKIYPTLGYLPSHPKLMEIYKVCEEKNIPVTTHCSRGVVHAYYRRIKNIEGWKIGRDGQLTNIPETRTFIFGQGNKYANYFNHPKNWAPILERHPKLRLNFGHFGGEKQWKRLKKGKNNTWVSRIIDFMMRYPNVYSDISFTNAHPELFDLIKSRMQNSQIIKERILYGYDYYMITVQGHFRSLKADFDCAFGENLIKQIGSINSKKFMCL